MSTLFNFVTVRNPRTPTKDEIGSGFIRYDEGLDAIAHQGAVAARAKGAAPSGASCSRPRATRGCGRTRRR